jgi:hypothetical protein
MDFGKLLRGLRGGAKEKAVSVVRGLAKLFGGVQKATAQTRPAFIPGHRIPGKPPKQSQRQQPVAPAKPQTAEPVAPQERQLSDDVLQMLAGQMHLVTSSNVHSIGMKIDQPDDRIGTLLVRFLGQQAKGKRSGLGALYEYYDVQVSLYREFVRAASKGEFVWDHLRVRGTISGHRYSYELAGITGGYVPRQAGLKRGKAGEYFMRRTFYERRIEGGRMVRVPIQSQLPERRVTMRGPNPERGPGIDQLRFE